MELEIAKFEKIGEYLAIGFFNIAFKYFLVWIVILVTIWILSGLFGLGKDDTDSSNWNRSGLKILTDSKTGLQYLSDGKGGLTLRVDATGLPVKSK